MVFTSITVYLDSEKLQGPQAFLKDYNYFSLKGFLRYNKIVLIIIATNYPLKHFDKYKIKNKDITLLNIFHHKCLCNKLNWSFDAKFLWRLLILANVDLVISHYG